MYCGENAVGLVAPVAPVPPEPVVDAPLELILPDREWEWELPEPAETVDPE